MIYLFTGTPGAGKTLNAIRFVDTDEAFKGRKIYYCNIPELTLDWEQITSEQASTWYDLPEGSVIVVDECQQIFPVRTASKQKPPGVARMDTHRHGGYDIVLITQSPKLLDSAVRAFVGDHQHYVRHFGQEHSRRFRWSECNESIQSRSTALADKVHFPKKYYGVYKSSSQHTHKKRLPWLVFAPYVFFGVALLLGGGWFVKNKSAHSTEPENQVHQSAPGDSILSTGTPLHRRGEELSFVESRTPEVKDVPWSAPAYRDVYEIKSFPRPQCYVWNTGNKRGQCKCVTQQATPMDVSYNVCMSIVTKGYFEEWREDAALVDNREERGRDETRNESGAPSSSVIPDRVAFLDAPKYDRQTRTIPRARYTGEVQASP